MLSRTLATEFSPGINLKHDLAGANWTYLMPRLELDHVVCIGQPSTAALLTLSRISDRVTLVVHAAETAEETESQILRRFQNVSIVNNIVEICAGGRQTADLFFLTDIASIRRLRDDPRYQVEIARLTNEQSLLYFEFGPLNAWLHRHTVAQLERQFGPVRQFWLTPLHGEMQTAVPADDRYMADYFVRQRLYSPSANISTLKQTFIRRRQPLPTRGPAKGINRSARSRKRLRTRIRKRSRSFLKAASVKAVRTMVAAERLLLKNERLFRRYGFFLHPARGDSAIHTARPPAYLRSIAASAGVDITKHRWGFSARGRYSSRKLLFYLVKNSGLGVGERGNNYIVKMVRDPRYNGRLENEYRALKALEERHLMKDATYPKGIFFGYHNGLAIAGESHVEGAPFRARTHATATCPHAAAAVKALIQLAVASACSEVSPEKISDALQQLLNAFTEIYRPTEATRKFLGMQIQTLREFEEEIPLVFQHGDPGTWNLFVTDEDRVAFLDWEAAEPQGMPLWDLFYFLRSYCTWVGQVQGTRHSLKGFEEQFLAEGPLEDVITDSVTRYCHQVGLATQLIEPLFYTCWMHRALKQATSLPINRLSGGHYLNLLRLTIQQRHSSPTLQRIFSEL